MSSRSPHVILVVDILARLAIRPDVNYCDTMSELDPPQTTFRPTWVTLLEIKVGQDAIEWMATRKQAVSLRDLAEEVTALIGHNVSHETVRRQLLATDTKTAS